MRAGEPSILEERDRPNRASLIRDAVLLELTKLPEEYRSDERVFEIAYNNGQYARRRGYEPEEAAQLTMHDLEEFVLGLTVQIDDTSSTPAEHELVSVGAQ